MIRFTNKRPRVGEWTITATIGSLFEYGISARGWHWARFGIFKLNEEITEGQYIQSADYSGFILMWEYWWPIKRSW